jgi:hypothetical protein
MVKISEILLSFLQKNKRMSLPGLGTFTLTDVAYAIPDKAQKAAFPKGSVSFVFSAATPEDPVLIAEISTVTGKIKPLASSDLEALVIQGKQLINISKTFMIDGLGSIQRTTKGEIEFVQLIDTDPKDILAKHTEDQGEAIKFSENYLKPSGKKTVKSKGLTIASLAIAGTLVLGWVGYFVYQQSVMRDSHPIIMGKEPMAIQDTFTQKSVLSKTEDFSPQQQAVDTSRSQKIPETEQPNNTVTSLSSISGSVNPGEKVFVKTDSIAKSVVKKKDPVRKKSVVPKVDPTATKISIPVKTPEAEYSAPIDSLSHR